MAVTVSYGPTASNMFGAPATSGFVRMRANLPEYVCGRKTWRESRYGSQIANGNPVAGKPSRGMMLLPGGAWQMSPLTASILNHITNDGVGSILDPTPGGGILDVAPGFDSVLMFRKPTETEAPGVSMDSSVISSGVPGIIKNPADGSNWGSHRLTADQVSFPPVSYSGYPDPAPMDRIMVSRQSYNPNNAFFVFFEALPGLYGMGRFLTFYFGGNTETIPRGLGGIFSLSFFSNGQMWLSELVGAPTGLNPWALRKKLSWANTALSLAGINVVYVIPYAWDRIAFFSPHIIFNLDIRNLFKAGHQPSFSDVFDVQSRLDALYNENRQRDGHIHKYVMTGQGILRADSRRDVRKIYSFGRLKYPVVSEITDEPFTPKGPISAGDLIYLDLDAYFVPSNITGATGLINVELFDANTNLPIGNGPVFGSFVATAARSYYPTFTFYSSLDRYTTPVLNGYTITCPGHTDFHNNTLIKARRIHSVSITGPSRDATNESAVISLDDPSNTANILRIRDGMRADLVVENDAGVVWSRLFEGVVARPEANQRTNAQTSSLPNWHSYPDLRFYGIFARLGEHIPLGFHSFLQDPDGSLDENGQRNPWRAAAIIRFLLNDCGVPDTEIDIPFYFDAIRLWPSPKLSSEDYQMSPGGDQPYLKVINKLCRDYLGAIFCRDPNAGSTGMWRILLNPGYDTPHLIDFRQYKAFAGYLGTSPNSWGAQATWIELGTYKEWVERPEVNYINVVGSSDPEDHGNITHKVEQEVYNYISHDWFPGTATSAFVNPFHEDYLGRAVPVYIIDPELFGQGAVNFYAQRVYQVAAHGRRGARFMAPFIHIYDDSDPHVGLPRPLRINDIVRVQRLDGSVVKGVIRVVRPSWRGSDRMRMAEYDVFFMRPEANAAAHGHIIEDRLRERYRRIALGSSGSMTYKENVWVRDARTVNDPAALQRLPTAPSVFSIQNHATGNFYFTPGISSIDGPDEIM